MTEPRWIANGLSALQHFQTNLSKPIGFYNQLVWKHQTSNILSCLNQESGYYSVMHSTHPTSVDGRKSRHLHRRPELLKALTNHVLENGVASLSLRPTADALGVTHSTLLRHFGSKELLIAAIVEAVCAELVARATDQVTDLTIPTDQLLRGAWQQLCEPGQQRQFVVLFELVALSARDPARYGALPNVLIKGFLEPIQENLCYNGWNPEESRELATAILAQIRGLQLDLAITGDLQRVNQAMYRYIDMITTDRRNFS